MPHNGQMNEKLGFYKSLCCGKEIVVPAGSQFPDCPNHRRLTTIWKPLVDDNIVRLGKAPTAHRRTARFKNGDQVICVGIGAHKGKRGEVTELIEAGLDHVQRYQVQLTDGTTIRCFGFELELFGIESSKTA